MKTKKWMGLFLVLSLLALTACGKKGADEAYEGEDGYEGYEITGGYDPLEYVTLGEYKGLATTDVSVSDEELQGELDMLLSDNQKYEDPIEEGEAKDGDTVNINYTGKLNGMAFDGGTAEDQLLELGSGSFIDGFEEQIVGREVGEEFTIDVTFPEDYQEETLKGQAVQFDIKLNYIQGEPMFTEVTDEFVASLEGEEAKTAQEYKDNLRERLSEDKKFGAMENLYAQVVEASTVKDYPSELLEVVRRRLDKSNRKAIEEQNGTTLEEYIEQNSETMSMEDFEKFLEESSKGILGETMIAEAIAKTEDIKITLKEIEEVEREYMEDMEMETKEDLDKFFMDEYGSDSKDFVHDNVLREKVLNFIFDQAKVAEATEEPEATEGTEATEETEGTGEAEATGEPEE